MHSFFATCVNHQLQCHCGFVRLSSLGQLWGGPLIIIPAFLDDVSATPSFFTYAAFGTRNTIILLPSNTSMFRSCSASIVALTLFLLWALSQNIFLYLAIWLSSRLSGVRFPSFSLMPNTMMPPCVFAKADNVSQKLSGKPPFADLYSNSVHSSRPISFLMSSFVIISCIYFSWVQRYGFYFKCQSFIIAHCSFYFFFFYSIVGRADGTPRGLRLTRLHISTFLNHIYTFYDLHIHTFTHSHTHTLTHFHL